MRSPSGTKLLLFGLQLSVIGANVSELFVLVIVGILVSMIGFVTDYANSIDAGDTRERIRG